MVRLLNILYTISLGLVNKHNIITVIIIIITFNIIIITFNIIIITFNIIIITVIIIIITFDFQAAGTIP